MKCHRRYRQTTVFFMVEGLLVTDNRGSGKVLAAQACTSVQLSGVITRMMKRGASVCTVVQITEEVFAAFYQEKGRAKNHG
jgi:hypothetical protein